MHPPSSLGVCECGCARARARVCVCVSPIHDLFGKETGSICAMSAMSKWTMEVHKTNIHHDQNDYHHYHHSFSLRLSLCNFSERRLAHYTSSAQWTYGQRSSINIHRLHRRVLSLSLSLSLSLTHTHKHTQHTHRYTTNIQLKVSCHSMV